MPGGSCEDRMGGMIAERTKDGSDAEDSPVRRAQARRDGINSDQVVMPLGPAPRTRAHTSASSWTRVTAIGTWTSFGLVFTRCLFCNEHKTAHAYETGTRDRAQTITRGHYQHGPNPSLSRTNVLADDRACTPVPPQNLNGKEGVNGSSPLEGFAISRESWRRLRPLPPFR